MRKYEKEYRCDREKRVRFIDETSNMASKQKEVHDCYSSDSSTSDVDDNYESTSKKKHSSSEYLPEDSEAEPTLKKQKTYMNKLHGSFGSIIQIE